MNWSWVCRVFGHRLVIRGNVAARHSCSRCPYWSDAVDWPTTVRREYVARESLYPARSPAYEPPAQTPFTMRQAADGVEYALNMGAVNLGEGDVLKPFPPGMAHGTEPRGPGNGRRHYISDELDHDTGCFQVVDRERRTHMEYAIAMSREYADAQYGGLLVWTREAVDSMTKARERLGENNQENRR